MFVLNEFLLVSYGYLRFLCGSLTVQTLNCIHIVTEFYKIFVALYNPEISPNNHVQYDTILQLVVGYLGKLLCPDEFQTARENTVSDSTQSGNKQLQDDSNFFYSPIRSTKYKTTDPEANRHKWKILGVVLDRFFFVFYFCTLLFAFIFIFPKPHTVAHLMWEHFTCMLNVYFFNTAQRNNICFYVIDSKLL